MAINDNGIGRRDVRQQTVLMLLDNLRVRGDTYRDGKGIGAILEDAEKITDYIFNGLPKKTPDVGELHGDETVSV